MDFVMPQPPFFFYGSLQAPELLSIVAGRPAETLELTPATLDGFAAVHVLDEAFPCLVEREGAAAQGAIMAARDEAEAARLVFFEDEEEFELRPVAVRTADGAVEAQAFFPRARLAPGPDWSYEDWRNTDRPLMLECAAEIMALYEQGVDWSDLSMWPGIKNRARARVRAGRENAARAEGAPPVGAEAVMENPPRRAVTETLTRPYASYFGIEAMEVRHETFGGGLSAPLTRAAFVSGDAVTVLPYDPARDEVLLIAQWRAGPHARGDAHPWPLEVIAGRLDADESAEAAARREALEEAGLELDAVEPVGGYYPSPGVMAEHITSYIAVADLSEAGGVHGLEEEGEDIAAIRLGFDEAMALLDRGAVNSATAMISLLQLARRREALREAAG
ncbi:NUDIX domain-containing protein [Rhodovulum sp. DZ06]|uniref:NUDIX domain-containing protein n=1 Tax=Rhodovulum sp. DZ06 TaxID=3425126 RepID=UPI003D3270AB